MARISGVKFLGIAPITGYESGVPTYGPVQEIKQFISFNGKKNFSEMSWYSNDVVEETFKNVVDVDLEIVVGRLSPELRATLMGSEYTEKGVMVEKSDDVQPEFALVVVLSQMGSKNGTLNQVYYRCKLTVEGVEAETKTDSVTDTQVTISGKAIPLADGRIAATIDSLDESADAGVVSGWTKSVYTGAEG